MAAAAEGEFTAIPGVFVALLELPAARGDPDIPDLFNKASLLENSLFQHAPTNTPPHVCSTNAMGLRAQCPSSMPFGRYYDRPPAVSEAFLWRFSYPQQVLQRKKSAEIWSLKGDYLSKGGAL